MDGSPFFTLPSGKTAKIPDGGYPHHTKVAATYRGGKVAATIMHLNKDLTLQGLNIFSCKTCCFSDAFRVHTHLQKVTRSFLLCVCFTFCLRKGNLVFYVALGSHVFDIIVSFLRCEVTDFRRFKQEVVEFPLRLIRTLYLFLQYGWYSIPLSVVSRESQKTFQILFTF